MMMYIRVDLLAAQSRGLVVVRENCQCGILVERMASQRCRANQGIVEMWCRVLATVMVSCLVTSFVLKWDVLIQSVRHAMNRLTLDVVHAVLFHVIQAMDPKLDLAHQVACVVLVDHPAARVDLVKLIVA